MANLQKIGADLPSSYTALESIYFANVNSQRETSGFGHPLQPNRLILQEAQFTTDGISPLIHTETAMALLVTSFAPWKAHQTTNASDDLIALLLTRSWLPEQTVLIRHLPVHSQLAPCQVITACFRQRPTTIVCCGMAEKRSFLCLEKYAHRNGDRLETSLDLHQLCRETQWTTISHDAGSYVCNDLYYQLLDHTQKHQFPVQCLFIHVPLITCYNRDLIAQDLAKILYRLHQGNETMQPAAA